MAFLNILFFLIYIQFKFVFCRKISPIFKLNNNLLFINKNNGLFNVSLTFTNFESANFYSNKIYLNNILSKSENCNVKLNKVVCLIKEMDNFPSEDIYIQINNEKKILKIKKIYYIINNIKNKIVLEFLSEEKYFLKIFDKQIQPINNLSKFIIDNFNIFNPIKINIYNAHNFQKIGKII